MSGVLVYFENTSWGQHESNVQSLLLNNKCLGKLEYYGAKYKSKKRTLNSCTTQFSYHYQFWNNYLIHIQICIQTY